MTATARPIPTPLWARDRSAWVELISHRKLDAEMIAKRMSNRKLGIVTGLSYSYIGHLRRGARLTCSPKTARAIEEALSVAPGSLFMVRVSHVPQTA